MDKQEGTRTLMFTVPNTDAPTILPSTASWTASSSSSAAAAAADEKNSKMDQAVASHNPANTQKPAVQHTPHKPRPVGPSPEAGRPGCSLCNPVGGGCIRVCPQGGPSVAGTQPPVGGGCLEWVDSPTSSCLPLPVMLASAVQCTSPPACARPKGSGEQVAGGCCCCCMGR
eukprot:1138749-Pelagomonas_calceolata.AAC.5